MNVHAPLAIGQEEEVVLDVPGYFVHLELERLLLPNLLRLEIYEGYWKKETPLFHNMINPLDACRVIQGILSNSG